MLADLVQKTRTVWRFQEEQPLAPTLLRGLIDLARLGASAEPVVLEEIRLDGDIRYWHDGQGGHHVPKRTLAQLLIEPPEGL